jgi:hypothetical protein
MAGTSWPALVAGARARAADVELKFDWIEGNLVPMTGGSQTDAAYDLGTTAARWRSSYFSTRVNTPAIGLSDASFLSFDATGTITANKPMKMTNGAAIDEFSIDGTLAGNSDLAVPTEKAVKTYVDANGGGPVAYAAANDLVNIGGGSGEAFSTLSITSDGGVYQILAYAYIAFTTTATTPAAIFEINKDGATVGSSDYVPGGRCQLRLANPNLTLTSSPIFMMGIMSLTSGGHTFTFKGQSTFYNTVTVYSFQIRKIAS